MAKQKWGKRPWVFFPKLDGWKKIGFWAVGWMLWIPFLIFRGKLMWLGIIRRTFDDEARRQDVPLWHYSNWIMAWTIMILGPILWGIAQLFAVDPVSLNWTFFTAIFLFLLAVVPEKFTALHCFIYGLIISLYVAIGGMLYFMDGTNIFLPIRNYFSDVETAFSGRLFLKISGLLAMIIMPLTWFWAYWSGRWVVTANGIYRKRVLGRTTLYKHTQIRLEEDFEDIPRWILLFGGGNLRIMRTDGSLLDEIRNIPFFATRWPRILKLWEAIQAQESISSPAGNHEDAEAVAEAE